MIVVDELVDVRHPEAHRLTGTAGLDDPPQAVRRLCAAGHIPHIRVGRRIRLSIPALKAWAAAQLAPQISRRNSETPNQVELETLS